MCGRYQLGVDPEELALLYRIQAEAWGRPAKLPNWNVAPRQSVPVVVLADGLRTGVTMRWGYPPVWVAREGKDPFDAPPLVNAKAEEAARKPTWSRSLRERRCLVLTTGFYEWLTRGKERFPLWFRPTDGRVLAFAGVWAPFDWGERKGWPCVSILTTTPNAEVAAVHDRMPVVLPPDREDAWLAPDADPAQFLHPAPDGTFTPVEANRSLNHREADGPGVIEADWTRAA